MIKKKWRFLLLIISFFSTLKTGATLGDGPRVARSFKDTAFLQAYSIKYTQDGLKDAGSIGLKKVYCDRNGV
ncbi:MAG: hypothetical protein ABI707_12245, partial [Ferruginibacter sp.]